MGYLVLARRLRPQTFEELIGQEGVTRTLRNAITSGRIAHAYLFCGPRGTGKTSAARILAKALNCLSGPTAKPCNTCDLCVRIGAGDDLDVIEIDAASNNGVDYIRELRQNAQYATGRARFKVYIIDEVHMLSTPAFNALLKTLEEPPEHVKFIFATTEPQKLPETVRSRCQRFDFRRLGAGEIAQALAKACRREKVEAAEDALLAVARCARGGMRDALSLLDQLISYANGPITTELVRELTGTVSDRALTDILEAISRGDAAATAASVGNLIDQGLEPTELAGALIERLHEILLLATCGADTDRVALAAEDRTRAAEMAESFGIDKTLHAIKLLSDARRESPFATDPRIPLEIAVLRVARTGDLADLRELAGQVAALVEVGGSQALSAPAPSRERAGFRGSLARPASDASAPPLARRSLAEESRASRGARVESEEAQALARERQSTGVGSGKRRPETTDQSKAETKPRPAATAKSAASGSTSADPADDPLVKEAQRKLKGRIKKKERATPGARRARSR